MLGHSKACFILVKSTLYLHSRCDAVVSPSNLSVTPFQHVEIPRQSGGGLRLFPEWLLLSLVVSLFSFRHFRSQ